MISLTKPDRPAPPALPASSWGPAVSLHFQTRRTAFGMQWKCFTIMKTDLHTRRALVSGTAGCHLESGTVALLEAHILCTAEN
ncbi:rCG56931 [Rattus norvegicus]|uniref:RCG56931 n=1 Tax=Rattus norvegicus TaxID=10116 RepID=A6JCZ5_RAT|nr:rCG56931 [Rattus norvegicus]